MLVKEDTFDPTEVEETATQLQDGKKVPEPIKSVEKSIEKVIVGVCSWKLAEGSHRKGAFQPPPLELSLHGMKITFIYLLAILQRGIIFLSTLNRK